MIATISLMWEEKVLKDCSIDCSSPISAKIWSKTAALLPSAAGMNKPDWAISCKSPAVFRVMVFPPVLGPVIRIVSKSSPKLMSLATTFFGSIKGWRAARSLKEWSLVKTGLTACIFLASLALAWRKSSWLKAWASCLMAGASSLAAKESSCRIRRISWRSSASRFCRRLFRFRMASGSTNKVCPDALWSWTTPPNLCRYSCLTGIT